MSLLMSHCWVTFIVVGFRAFQEGINFTIKDLLCDSFFVGGGENLRFSGFSVHLHKYDSTTSWAPLRCVSGRTLKHGVAIPAAIYRSAPGPGPESALTECFLSNFGHLPCSALKSAF